MKVNADKDPSNNDPTPLRIIAMIVFWSLVGAFAALCCGCDLDGSVYFSYKSATETQQEPVSQQCPICAAAHINEP